MYGNNRTWAHDSIGTSAPATHWYLAEGSTGAGFETWVLVQNPQTSAARVSLEYMTTAGEVEGPVVVVPPGSRTTFNVAASVPATYDVSTLITSDRPVVAERAMYGDAK